MFESIKLEEQKTRHKILKDLLKTASKKMTGKSGFPEFIVTFPSIIDLVLIVECKPEIKFHRSKKGNEAEKYAVDGALHYSKFLKKDFNVIAIAISGEDEDKDFCSKKCCQEFINKPSLLKKIFGKKKSKRNVRTVRKKRSVTIKRGKGR